MQREIKIPNQDGCILVGESYKNLKKYMPYNKHIILLTDIIVFDYYKNFISEYPHIIIGCGEELKTLHTVSDIVKKLLKLGADRNSFLVGVGGGIVTDITGFVASVFMRGIDFGFISTSLLGQVDASLGGKTGVNFLGYKNMIGVFKSPKFVICDPMMLDTLTQDELRSGFGEILKYAFIKDKNLYNYLARNTEKLLALENDAISFVVNRSIEIKATVVGEDYLERGERKKLNYGHTLGHAIENNSSLKHGEAVAVGMVWEAKLSKSKGVLSEDNTKKINQLVRQFALPDNYSIDKEVLRRFVKKDKKKYKDSIDFVFLKDIGEAFIENITFEELFSLIDKEL